MASWRLMKRRRVEFAEVELREGDSAWSYRLRVGGVELEVPRGFDPDEVFALLLLMKEAQL